MVYGLRGFWFLGFGRVKDGFELEGCWALGSGSGLEFRALQTVG